MSKIATSLFLILSVFMYSENTDNNKTNLPPALVLNYSSTNPLSKNTSNF